ncbi:DsbC family protein [Arenicella xantha]|uniref:Thiol:disulfide interchange protein n=1 Tax=Arenicella xantha TaxID=644221 RepID=A0A395JKG8_9GAMM|nr:DsbC family protein [Arenicella xantha]RBP51049.1 thiol:disulfide interchange protein DsbC [Arenicella xantha]
MKNIILTLYVAMVCGAISEVRAEGLEERLQAVFGDQSIQVSDHDAQLKSVVVGTSNFYTTHDGRYVFAGPVIDTQRQVDLVAEKEALARKTLLSEQPESLFIRYPSSNGQKHQITVFTDIDCPYCRKLHNYMDDMNQRGITVNYVMLPRAGVDSASYTKTLNALCSDTPAAAITDAMQGQIPAPQNCEATQLNQQMSLARALSITSTPTVVLPNGELKPGFMTPDRLMSLIELANRRLNDLDGAPL